ncbi:MAG: hypothetical protein IJ364_01130 [Oscillospiraceae bacterium]|nr:hypothetical protein [Oscillospiraceae bacterium]
MKSKRDWLTPGRKQREAFTKQGACLTDAQAAQNVTAYPEWKAGIEITQDMIDVGENRYRVGEQLYKTTVPHTTIDSWAPGVAITVWTPIDLEHTGTIDDPVTAARSMEYVYGLYYYDPEDTHVYLCERSGEAAGGKVTLAYLPHELVGHYFTLAK